MFAIARPWALSHLAVTAFVLAAGVIVAVTVAGPAAADDAQTECYSENGSPDQAIIACSQVIKADSRAVRAYFSRGNAYQFKGELDRAIADYDEAIALDPKLAIAYNNRGNAYQAKRDHDRAIADFDKTIALDEKDAAAAAYFNRGNSYQAKGELDRAIADFDKAIAFDPTHAAAYTAATPIGSKVSWIAPSPITTRPSPSTRK